MKTTVELPDTLMREVKIRAVLEGRKLKDVVADLLRRGLDAPETPPCGRPSSQIIRDDRTGLPLIICSHPAVPGSELTPERVAEILLDQEAVWADETRR